MSPQSACILGCAGPTLTKDEKSFFSKVNPFGFILFSRNLESLDQIRALTADLRATTGAYTPIFIDQEGGRVQRLRPPLARQWRPPLDDVTRFGIAAEQALDLRYRIISAELLDLGIDGNCAPALDVARPDTHQVLRNRLLADNVADVVRLGRVVAEAHLASGVLPVIKHMPGHGLGKLDSHLALPRVSAPRAELDAVDFAAFAPFADMPLGMTCHLLFDAIDPARPATVSPDMIALIRNQIGFDGLLMTDDISMQALSGSVAERGRAALAAGCDLVLHCNGDLEEMRALTDETGPLGRAARDRALRALNRRQTPGPVDIAALAAEFEALSRNHPET